jgi:hypothetical protein
MTAEKIISLKKRGPPLSPGMGEYIKSVLRTRKTLKKYKIYININSDNVHFVNPFYMRGIAFNIWKMILLASKFTWLTPIVHGRNSMLYQKCNLRKMNLNLRGQCMYHVKLTIYTECRFFTKCTCYVVTLEASFSKGKPHTKTPKQGVWTENKIKSKREKAPYANFTRHKISCRSDPTWWPLM